MLTCDSKTNLDGAPVTSESHTHPSHSQTLAIEMYQRRRGQGGMTSFVHGDLLVIGSLLATFLWLILSALKFEGPTCCKLYLSSSLRDRTASNSLRPTLALDWAELAVSIGPTLHSLCIGGLAGKSCSRPLDIGVETSLVRLKSEYWDFFFWDNGLGSVTSWNGSRVVTR